MKTARRTHSVLHVDLGSFFVAVERSLDPSLRDRPVIVGGGAASSGVVAAASAEARAKGVQPGQSVLAARRLCPEGAFRPGDFEAYARASDEVTAILFSASRRVERPSADEAYLDLTPEPPSSANPVTAAESIKDLVRRRLGLDVALGLAACRLAARVASSFARPRGLVIVLPGYDASFLARQPIAVLPDLPPYLETALMKAGVETLGQLAEAEEEALAAIVGTAAAARLRRAARGGGEPRLAVSAPPAFVQIETAIRDRRSDRPALGAVLDGLVERAWRRLRPFGLRPGLVTLEVRRSDGTARRHEDVTPGLADEGAARELARSLAGPLFDSPAAVKAIQLRFGRLAPSAPQSALFPDRPSLAR